MEERDGREIPEGGLMGLDRETFSQVWSRVAPDGGGPIEPVAPPPQPAPRSPQPDPQPAQEQEGEDRESRQLQALVLGCLTDGSVYRDLARRTRRSVGDLQELYQQKLRQAKRLSAAYFLLTGVRYWPREVTPVNPPEGFFPALRQRYLAEGRLSKGLADMAEASQDETLRELYADLSQETHDMVRAIRAIVERET